MRGPQAKRRNGASESGVAQAKRRLSRVFPEGGLWLWLKQLPKWNPAKGGNMEEHLHNPSLILSHTHLGLSQNQGPHPGGQFPSGSSIERSNMLRQTRTCIT